MKIGWIFFLILTNCGNMFLNFCRVYKFKVELCLFSTYAQDDIMCTRKVGNLLLAVSGFQWLFIQWLARKSWRSLSAKSFLGAFANVWPHWSDLKSQDIDFSKFKGKENKLSSFTLLSSGHYDCCDPKFSISKNVLGKKIQ